MALSLPAQVVGMHGLAEQVDAANAAFLRNATTPPAPGRMARSSRPPRWTRAISGPTTTHDAGPSNTDSSRNTDVYLDDRGARRLQEGDHVGEDVHVHARLDQAGFTPRVCPKGVRAGRGRVRSVAEA